MLSNYVSQELKIKKVLFVNIAQRKFNIAEQRFLLQNFFIIWILILWGKVKELCNRMKKILQSIFRLCRKFLIIRCKHLLNPKIIRRFCLFLYLIQNDKMVFTIIYFHESKFFYLNHPSCFLEGGQQRGYYSFCCFHLAAENIL